VAVEEQIVVQVAVVREDLELALHYLLLLVMNIQLLSEQEAQETAGTMQLVLEITHL
jgi:hypothetical protein